MADPTEPETLGSKPLLERIFPEKDETRETRKTRDVDNSGVRLAGELMLGVAVLLSVCGGVVVAVVYGVLWAFRTAGVS